MVNAIVKQELSMSVWSMIQQVAASAKGSGKLNLFRSEEAEMKMLVAWENGFPLTSAYANVHIINGIPTLSPKAIWAKCIIHPEFSGYKEERLTSSKGEFQGYQITLKRKNGVEATRKFTLEDAKKAKLDAKDNWQMYAENMCFWRAIGFAEDVVFPDVTLGIVSADALGAYVTQDGDVIEGSWEVKPTQKQMHTGDVENSMIPVKLGELIEKYGAGKVLFACGNKLPTTVDEVHTLAAILLRDLDEITIDGVDEVIT